MVGTRSHVSTPGSAPQAGTDERYQWIALSNTTMAVFMSAVDGSIVIISLPAIFRGIHLDPLAPGNIGYLLWMIMGYRLVQAVFVVTLGRLGDMYGRVKIYNAGFAVFAVASVLLSFDPFRGGHGALWLIGWRVLQAIGGSMLTANSAAILTDAFPANRRGFALGINQIASIAGQFIGLVAGGALAALDWRAVFWVNVPVGVLGTVWAYRSLRETGERHRDRIDWWGNLTFAVGLSTILIAVTNGIQPYHGHSMGWTNPTVFGSLIGGAVLLAVFVLIESKIAAPMFQLGLFRIRAFAAGSTAGLIASAARGGLQFMLIIWLQGIWLPLHGYDYTDTPLWAGIFLLPMTVAFLVAGPISGILSDRYGSRGFATAGMLVFGASFIGFILLPVNFPYWAFALLIVVNGIGVGMFSSPNSASIMSSVPARQRGAASGMRSTFQNTGTAISIGAFFSLMIAGLASTLPRTLTNGLQQQGVSHSVAQHVGSLPPVSSLFAAVLGTNPIKNLLAPSNTLSTLPRANQQTLTGNEFFPHLISGPFHHGLVLVFSVAAGLSVIAALASLLRGGPQERANSIQQKRRRMTLTQIDTVPALVVIDLQKGLAAVETVHAFGDIVGRAAQLAAAFRRRNFPVVLVNAAGVAPGRTDAQRFRPADFSPPPEWIELVPELGVEPTDFRLTKYRAGAFHDTGLHSYLKQREVTQVVVAGIATTMGVESTARAAHEHGYHVVFATDAMTDRDADTHRISVERIFPRIGECATTAEILAKLDPATAK